MMTCTDEQLSGGTVAVLIKYKGNITVLNKVFNICDLVKTCPIDGGELKMSLTETIPSYAPSVSLTSPKIHHSTPLISHILHTAPSLIANTGLIKEYHKSSNYGAKHFNSNLQLALLLEPKTREWYLN